MGNTMNKIVAIVASSLYLCVYARVDVVKAPNLTNQQTVLHQLVKRGNSVDEMTRLLESGFDPNDRDIQYRTPLHWAAIYARPDEADLLLSKGADVNAKDFQGNTPLHLAGRWSTNLAGRKKMINNLIFYGGDVFARNDLGYTVPEVGNTIGVDNQELMEGIIQHLH